MKKYEKPIIVMNEMLAEGVYTASGDANSMCNSDHMHGHWQKPDYSDWGDGHRGYKDQFGCIGCPAYTDTGCGLNSHYPNSGPSGSYDQDNGHRKPSWEMHGHQPYEPVRDWNCG